MELRSSVALPADARSRVADAEGTLRERGFPAALWERTGSAWPAVPADELTPWIGWAEVVAEMVPRAGELMRWAEEVRSELPRTTLLGMGGSSLCSEVLRRTFGLGDLAVLDTTHPAAVRREERDDCVYITASKSGGTIETRSHDAYFFRRSGENPARFVAVTDPGTALADLAGRRGYRRVFENRPDIGGRYSALSYFGLVPAALAGLDLERLLASASEMAGACRRETDNPGLALGAALGALALAGRDKVTIVATGPHESFGVWAEQLLAESTGKRGKGLIPVAGEELGPPEVYGDDRVFVHLRASDARDSRLEALAEAGHPVITLDVTDPYDLGAEFFRWEVATAAAGSLLEINPFDQPNVQESKDNTSRLLAEWRETGSLPSPESDPVETVLGALHPGGYLAMLAYVDPGDAGQAELFERVRHRIRDTLRVATTFGYGPRYLHSTGQLHKGGPPVGCFLQVVDPDPVDLPIPGERFGFATLFSAQSIGDLQALRGRGRPVARVTPAELEAAVDSVLSKLGGS